MRYTPHIVCALACAALLATAPVFAEEAIPTTTSVSPTKSFDKERLNQMLMDLKKNQNKKKEGGHATSTEAKMALKNLDGSCIQNLVAKRDEKLYTSFQKFTTDILAALNARRTAVFDAWGNSDTAARAKALARAWQEWKTDSKEANTALRTARKGAWETFRTDAKAECKVTVPKEESLGADTSGAISL